MLVLSTIYSVHLLSSLEMSWSVLGDRRTQSSSRVPLPSGTVSELSFRETRYRKRDAVEKKKRVNDNFNVIVYDLHITP